MGRSQRRPRRTGGEATPDEAEIHHLAGRDDHALKALDRARELYTRKGVTVGSVVVARQAAVLGLD